jgi:hypothetical protein
MVSTRSKANGNGTAAAAAAAFVHTPTNFTLLWMFVSLPLVVWDTIYVLGRPWTMPGGAWHYPLWVPYELYGNVDHVYGWKAFNAGNGFTSAQGFLNAVETAMYFYYLYLVYARGGSDRTVEGRTAARATIVAFSAAVMTLSKTVLYWANEYYSGFDNIGHNSLIDLVFLWIIPNGAWLVGSTYMIWSIGGEIVDGLASVGHAKKD